MITNHSVSFSTRKSPFSLDKLVCIVRYMSYIYRGKVPRTYDFRCPWLLDENFRFRPSKVWDFSFHYYFRVRYSLKLRYISVFHHENRSISDFRKIGPPLNGKSKLNFRMLEINTTFMQHMLKASDRKSVQLAMLRF